MIYNKDNNLKFLGNPDFVATLTIAKESKRKCLFHYFIFFYNQEFCSNVLILIVFFLLISLLIIVIHYISFGTSIIQDYKIAR